MSSWHVVQVNDSVAVDTWARGIYLQKAGCLPSDGFTEEKFPNPSDLSVLECKKSIVCLFFEEGRIWKWEGKEKTEKPGKNQR